MMRKLLIFMLVLGMASAASAARVMVLDVTMGPSSTLIIEATTGYAGADDDLYWAMVGDVNEITITDGNATAGAPTDSQWSADNANAVGFSSDPCDGSWGFIGDTGGSAKSAGDYINDIDYAFVGAYTQAWVYLISTTDWSTYTLEGSGLIPEPASMALLGLGGLLFLRRRRK